MAQPGAGARSGAEPPAVGPVIGVLRGSAPKVQGDVVDQPGRADLGGDGEDRLAGVVVRDLGEVGRVDQGQVVQDERRLEPRGLVEDRAGGGADGGGAAPGRPARRRARRPRRGPRRARQRGGTARAWRALGPRAQRLLGGEPVAAANRARDRASAVRRSAAER